MTYIQQGWPWLLIVLRVLKIISKTWGGVVSMGCHKSSLSECALLPGVGQRHWELAIFVPSLLLDHILPDVKLRLGLIQYAWSGSLVIVQLWDQTQHIFRGSRANWFPCDFLVIASTTIKSCLRIKWKWRFFGVPEFTYIQGCCIEFVLITWRTLIR